MKKTKIIFLLCMISFSSVIFAQEKLDLATIDKIKDEGLKRSQIMDIMFNFRSFVHFQRLRNSEHAQFEVRALAQRMLELVQTIPGNPFKHTLAAFGLDKIKAPK